MDEEGDTRARSSSNNRATKNAAARRVSLARLLRLPTLAICLLARSRRLLLLLLLLFLMTSRFSGEGLGWCMSGCCVGRLRSTEHASERAGEYIFSLRYVQVCVCKSSRSVQQSQRSNVAMSTLVLVVLKVALVQQVDLRIVQTSNDLRHARVRVCVQSR